MATKLICGCAILALVGGDARAHQTVGSGQPMNPVTSRRTLLRRSVTMALWAAFVAPVACWSGTHGHTTVKGRKQGSPLPPSPVELGPVELGRINLGTQQALPIVVALGAHLDANRTQSVQAKRFLNLGLISLSTAALRDRFFTFTGPKATGQVRLIGTRSDDPFGRKILGAESIAPGMDSATLAKVTRASPVGKTRPVHLEADVVLFFDRLLGGGHDLRPEVAVVAALARQLNGPILGALEGLWTPSPDQSSGVSTYCDRRGAVEFLVYAQKQARSAGHPELANGYRQALNREKTPGQPCQPFAFLSEGDPQDSL